MKRLALLVFLAACGPALADVVSGHADNVVVTFYHTEAVSTSELLHSTVPDSGFAFITETRTIDLPAGPTIVRFRDVASTMVPQTADIQGLPAGVLERNFDYDLLSPGSLLAKSIGETVRIVRTDKKTGKSIEEKAIVRSGPDGAVLEISGRLEALHCSALSEKLVFDHVPDGLADVPTLSVRTTAPQAGRYTIKLSYLATGLNWSADYVVRTAPGSDTLTLTGWLTLANSSATSFAHAPVNAIAGKPQTTGNDEPVYTRPIALGTSCWPTNIDWGTYPHRPPLREGLETVVVTAQRRAEDVQSVPMAVTAMTQDEIKPQEFGDYKLYPLPAPTDLRARETKQIQFLDQESVKYARIYRYTVEDSSAEGTEPAAVIFRVLNKTESGLGKPLPAGSVSVFEPAPDGSLLFAGQASIEDMAIGLPVEVATGRTTDVRVAPRRVQSETSGEGNDKTVTDTWEITIANDKSMPVAFELVQDLYGGRAEILTESLSHGTKAGRAVWNPMPAAGQRLVIRYVIRHPD